jgi:hypothetical protein
MTSLNAPSTIGKWILDTGASNHMCGDRTLFLEYRENTDPSLVIQTASDRVQLIRTGTVHLTLFTSNNEEVQVKLLDVVYMPGLTTNLLSRIRIQTIGVYIDGLAKVLRYMKTKQELCAYDTTNTAMIVRTSPSTVKKINCPIDITSYKAILDDTIELWHRRLGHLGHENVKKTATLTDGITIRDMSHAKTCKACLLAKSKRTVSRMPQVRSTEAFDKIHVDVISPITPKAYNGHKWAIIFTDDCDRLR